MNVSSATKTLTVAAYSAFLKMRDKTWNPPKIEATRKTEQELDALIYASGRNLAVALQIAKETALRIGEILRLKWSDVDFERRLIILNQPEKHCSSRIFRVSDKLIDMLNSLPRRNERIFRVRLSTLLFSLNLVKKRLATKMQNPRFLKISFHTFRHWKATMEYHKTKDILHVKEVLGHTKIDSTLLYVQIERALFNEAEGEFHSAVAKTTLEASKLIESGFDYVCTTPEGVMLFRKRKQILKVGNWH